MLSELKNLQSRIQAVDAFTSIKKIASEGNPRVKCWLVLNVRKTWYLDGASAKKESRHVLRPQRRHNSGASSELSELPKYNMLPAGSGI